MNCPKCNIPMADIVFRGDTTIEVVCDRCHRQYFFWVMPVGESQPVAITALKEKLAEYAHTVWSAWMKYVFKKCSPLTSEMVDVTLSVIPAWAVDRWTRQMNTLYQDLPEEQKESCREEADKILAIIKKAGEQG